MGSRGPQPKPNVLKLIDGNPGKRPVGAPGVVATGEPFIPDDLHDHAIECIEMIKRMMPPKVYAEVDGFALSAFATAYAWHRHCRHAMNDPNFQPMVLGSTGIAKRPNPYFKLLKDQSDQMRAWGTRLGLDPAARQALTGGAQAPERPPSKFDGLMGGRKA